MTDTPESPVAIAGITRAKAAEPDLSDAAITGNRYYSREFADREAEHLWPHVWQVAGRVDQIPEAGDYVTYEIGRDSILCARGDDGRVRAFFNVCQHRGNRLVHSEHGSLAGPVTRGRASSGSTWTRRAMTCAHGSTRLPSISTRTAWRT